MINKFLTACLFIPFVFTAACTAAKKLEVAQGQLNELSNTNKQLRDRANSLQGELNDCSAGFKSTLNDLNQCVSEYKRTKDKLEAAHEILEEQNDIMHQVESKIKDALVDFKNKGVEVFFNKGLVHVSMEDQLLYKTGSSRLDERGKQALSNLATVLNGYPNLKVIVLGNTDDVKFKNGMDNWTLSTERANGVVRILRDHCKMDPARLTAAGKGMYNPVADNTSEEGRAKNRRTDIILNPDLDRLWDSIEN
jgi:chemotaxis protein MotB